MEGHEMIALYEHVAILSGHMLDAARRSDWDRLTELESLCARQVAALRGSDPPGRLDDEERGRKID
jgi:flagellar protein FliT